MREFNILYNLQHRKLWDVLVFLLDENTFQIQDVCRDKHFYILHIHFWNIHLITLVTLHIQTDNENIICW